MIFETLLSDIVATVVGGIILTILFFLFREKCFALPQLNGKWHFMVETKNSDYNPYKGMCLEYVVMLWLEDNKIHGTYEKVYENSSTGEREYTGSKRTRGTIEGSIEKKYLSKDIVNLHLIEEGKQRTSTTSQSLVCETLQKQLVGTFHSTVANQSGIVKWQRNQF
ncbi:MAG: hypothetical protein ACI8ZB_005031 [Desulforhopalus sp.]|jgi:hypothetical protein